jgi:hypothetical protein
MTSVVAMFAAWALVSVYILRVYRRHGLQPGGTVSAGANWFEDANLPPRTSELMVLGFFLGGLSFLFAYLLPASEYDTALMFLLFGAAVGALDLIWKVDLRAFASGFAMKHSLVIVLLAGVIVVGCSVAVGGREALFAVPSLLLATAVVRARRAIRNEVQ